LARQESQFCRLARRCCRITQRLFTSRRFRRKRVKRWRLNLVSAEEGGERRLAASWSGCTRGYARRSQVKLHGLAPLVCILPPGTCAVIGIIAGARRDERKVIGALYADQLKPVTDVNPHPLGY
jgi:hypothetical protein